MTPIRISTTLITIASTGRRMDVSERIIWRALFCWRGLRVGGCHLHCRAIVQLGLAGGHAHIASGQPGKDFDRTGAPFARELSSGGVGQRVSVRVELGGGSS